MGNKESTVVDDSVEPETLSSRTLEGLAEYITSGRCRRVVVMSGAGISTSAGIPDFRSPETGLYANLQRLDLPHAEAVFDIAYFRQNPRPFYTLAHELYPGTYRPTITHAFIRLLHDRGLLLKHFTQNIDCLDREAGVPGSHIVEAHGSFAEQSCIECRAPYPADLMRAAVRDEEPPHCAACGGLVKPEIVFFGEQLPPAFFHARALPGEADLCIVVGTSLTVFPFAGLPQLVREGVPRVLINQERVGEVGSRADDVVLLGDCDAQVRRLAAACGWLEELEELGRSVGVGQKATPKADKTTTKDSTSEPPATKDGDDVAAGDEKKQGAGETVAAEVDALTAKIDQTLSISKEPHDDNATEKDVAAKVEDHLAGHTEDDDSTTEGPKATPTESQGRSETPTAAADLSHVFPHIKSNLT